MTTPRTTAPADTSSSAGAARSPEYRKGYEAGYHAARYRALRADLHRPARWNPDLKEFELQCPDCVAKCRQSYWPLSIEFWNPRTVRRCRACIAERDRDKQRERRKNPAARAHDLEMAAAWRDRHPGYNAETAAIWRKLNPERKREQDRAYHAKRKAA
jgi:hypothetical protein